jgi:hypothetical protein
MIRWMKTRINGHMPGSVAGAVTLYSITPLIRTQVIRITSYSDRLSPSGKHFRALIVHLLVALIPPPPLLSNSYKELCISILGM